MTPSQSSKPRHLTPDSAPRRPESVLVLIYDEQHQVLLIERADYPGYWQSVTGGLEVGEMPLVAAKREVFEETGLDASRICDLNQRATFEIHPRWRHRYAPHVTMNLEHQFALQVPVGSPIQLCAEEHVNYQWLPAEQAIRKISSWSNRQAIERVLLELHGQDEQDISE